MKKLMTIVGAIFCALVFLAGCKSGVEKENKKVAKTEEVPDTAEKIKNNEIAPESKKEAEEKKDVYTFKDMACNDAACECNACFYKFIREDGKELIINEIDEKSASVKLYKTIEHDDEGGWVEVIPNKKYVNKKFHLSFIVTKCVCDDLEPNNNYKKLTSIKMIE